jgi:hypothetical protein
MNIKQMFYLILVLLLILLTGCIRNQVIYKYDKNIGGSAQIAGYELTEGNDNISLMVHLVKKEKEPDYLSGVGLVKPYVRSDNTLHFPADIEFGVNTYLEKYDERDYFMAFFPNVKLQRGKIKQRKVVFTKNEGEVELFEEARGNGAIFIFNLFTGEWRDFYEINEQNDFYEIHSLQLIKVEN